jgi:hypothetical protein
MFVHGVHDTRAAGVGEVSLVTVAEIVNLDAGGADIVVKGGQSSVCYDGVDD